MNYEEKTLLQNYAVIKEINLFVFVIFIGPILSLHELFILFLDL